MIGFKSVFYLRSDSPRVSSPKNSYTNVKGANKQMLPKNFPQILHFFQCIYLMSIFLTLIYINYTVKISTIHVN